ncbi:helix-turn-helix transcriptional regulator [Streptomyces sp. NPDC058892]|uniref:helix-turn-helix transcriptional regulator n=1 Tax=unclassified Streptomyces TaxID=2593676 RepID=UPI0036BCB1F1
MTALWPARPAGPAEDRTATGRVGGPHRGRGRLIGRTAETARIADALAAARSGRGGALFITGEPGVGKTRLATEALAAAAATDMITLRGRASTVGPPVPYRPLVEALLLLARAGLLPDPGESGAHCPVLARLLSDTPETGTGGHAAVSHIAVAETVLRLLAAVGRERGCLLVLDDLHDADAGTLAVVEYLLDNIGQQPAVLLLVAGGTPRAAAELAVRARQREAAEILDLKPLTRPEVRLLVAAELGVAPVEVCPGLLHRAVTDSAGIPFVVKELVHDHAARPADRGERAPSVPAAVADDVRRRTEALGPLGTRFLGTAALFGRRFPLPVLEHALGVDHTALSEVLRAALAACLITPDGPGTRWYAFRSPLAAEALLDGLGPGERARHARRAARALAHLHPGLPGVWRAHAARLHEHAGEDLEAARLYGEAAQRAMEEVALERTAEQLPLERALELLTRAHALLEPAAAPALHATVLELLLDAAAHSAHLDRLPRPPAVEQGVPAARRAGIHARLGTIATLTGRPAEALRHLDTARSLLTGHPADGHTAFVDLAAAHAELGRLDPDRLHTAARLARRAVDAARGADRPDVVCGALLLLGQLARHEDETAATAHFERARAIALAHRLPVPRSEAEVQLAITAAGHDHRPTRLEQAGREAHRRGLLPLALEAGSALALERIRRCAFDEARDGIIEAAAEASGPGLGRSLAMLRLADAVRYAHQGRRAEMHGALERLEPLLDAAPGLRALSYGTARAFCSLLEERHDAAEAELAQALAHDAENPAAGDFGRHGIIVLLGVLAGRIGRRHCPGIAEAATGGSRWNRQFAGLAHAVLLGREGHRERATAVAAEALAAAAPYPMARCLGMRLVARSAYEDGWGAPVQWLREAEEYFHGAGLHPVAGAARALLRGMGASVRQRRTGTEQVPPDLRRSGITVREFEVAQLVAERISNKDIAGRLHISLRTVEKHVANVLHKTGHPNRRAFASAARDPGGVLSAM